MYMWEKEWVCIGVSKLFKLYFLLKGMLISITFLLASLWFSACNFKFNWCTWTWKEINACYLFSLFLFLLKLFKIAFQLTKTFSFRDFWTLELCDFSNILFGLFYGLHYVDYLYEWTVQNIVETRSHFI